MTTLAIGCNSRTFGELMDVELEGRERVHYSLFFYHHHLLILVHSILQQSGCHVDSCVADIAMDYCATFLNSQFLYTAPGIPSMGYEVSVTLSLLKKKIF